MTQTEDVLAEYVERLFAKASLMSLAVLGHGRLLEDGCLRPDGNRLEQLQSLATELEFGLGMLHDRLSERHELACFRARPDDRDRTRDSRPVRAGAAGRRLRPARGRAATRRGHRESARRISRPAGLA
jgi:hypothetical protein